MTMRRRVEHARPMALRAGRVARQLELEAVRIVAIGTNHPVLMHLALQERAVDIDLFLHLPIRRVQARFQQTDLILISEGRGRLQLREFMSTDRNSIHLTSSHYFASRMPTSA